MIASPAAPFSTPLPTPQPTTPTPTPATSSPSAPPDVVVSSETELVHVDMLLSLSSLSTGDSAAAATADIGILAGRAAIAWESVTARHIEERARNERNWRVSITTNIDDQQIVTTTTSDGFGVRSRRRQERRRFLQGDDTTTTTTTDSIKPTPLLIKFDATVDFISVPRSVSAQDLIGEAFNSGSDREMYRDNLLAADPVFSFVTDVQIRVEGAVPIEEEDEPLESSQANNNNDNNNNNNNSMVGVIVGIIVIGVVLLLVALLFIVLRRRRRRHYSEHHQRMDETNPSMQPDPNNLAVVTVVAALPADKLIRYRYVEEIMVNNNEDDDAVSAMTPLPGLDGSLSVMEDPTVSVNLGYDFVKQQKTDSTDDNDDNESEEAYSYDASASRGKTTVAGTSVSQTLLGLDYLEEVTIEEDDDDAILYI
jgi:hypothetical protein